MKTISHPTTPEDKEYAWKQEARRKDIERAFGRMQIKWAVLQTGCRLLHLDEIVKIWMTIAILHNLTIRDQQEEGKPPENLDRDEPEGVNEAQQRRIQERMKRVPFSYTKLVDGTLFTENRGNWMRLRDALLAHVWLNKKDQVEWSCGVV